MMVKECGTAEREQRDKTPKRVRVKRRRKEMTTTKTTNEGGSETWRGTKEEKGHAAWSERGGATLM